MNCLTCKSKLIKKSNESPTRFSTKKYCSKKCYAKGKKETARGKGNNFWKGGSLKWHKKQALIRDDYTCQICGLRDIEIMEVDHIKESTKFPELKMDINNLLTLCPNCHRRKTNRFLKLNPSRLKR